MTDSQMEAAGWLQVEGWTISRTDEGFIAVHGYACMWVIATLRKTVAGCTDGDDMRRVECRRSATIEVVRQLIAEMGRNPGRSWKDRITEKGAPG